MNSKLLLVLLTSLSITASGCKMIKNMDEMHDATVGMRKTTEGMSETTEKMYDGMNETKYISKQMLLGMRPKEARDTRNKEWKYLLESKTMSEKLDAAASFVQAMEFQSFEPRFEDEVDRQALFKTGLEELVQKSRSLIKNRDKTSATQSSARMQNLYALAAQLHKVSLHQEEKAQEWGFTPMSVYDVAIQGMKNQWALTQNIGSVNDYETNTSTTIAARWMEDMTYLLRVRANFLAAYVFVMMAADTNGDEPSKLDKIWTVVKTSVFKKKWSTNLYYRNTKQIEYYNFILNLALTTRNDLYDLGITPMTDEKIVKILEKADFSDVEGQVAPSPNEPKSIKEKRRALEELKATIAKYINSNS